MLGVWLRSIVQEHNTHQKYLSLLPLPITLAYYTYSLPKLTTSTHYLYSLPYLYKLINALPYFWHRGWTHPSCANQNTKCDILKQMEGRCWDACKLRGLRYHLMIIIMSHGLLARVWGGSWPWGPQDHYYWWVGQGGGHFWLVASGLEAPSSPAAAAACQPPSSFYSERLTLPLKWVRKAKKENL